jgi:hypothetical protein
MRLVFAISAAHPLLYQNYLEEPQPCETNERMNFNVIEKGWFV